VSTHEYSRSSIIHHPSSMITLRLSRSYGIRNRFPFEQALSATSRVFTPYVHMYIHTYIHTYIHMCSLVVQWSISYSVYSIQYTVYSVQCSTYCTYSCAAHNVAQSVIRPAPSSFLFLLSLPPFSSSFLFLLPLPPSSSSFLFLLSLPPSFGEQRGSERSSGEYLLRLSTAPPWPATRATLSGPLHPRHLGTYIQYVHAKYANSSLEASPGPLKCAHILGVCTFKGPG